MNHPVGVLPEQAREGEREERVRGREGESEGDLGGQALNHPVGVPSRELVVSPQVARLAAVGPQERLRGVNPRHVLMLRLAVRSDHAVRQRRVVELPKVQGGVVEHAEVVAGAPVPSLHDRVANDGGWAPHGP